MPAVAQSGLLWQGCTPQLARFAAGLRYGSRAIVFAPKRVIDSHLMQRAQLSPLALGAAAGAVYAARACPTVSTFGDSAELGAAAALWGVPHPPGYPLLTLVGHLFASVPIGDIAWRIHLTSVAYHTATLLVVAYAVLNWTQVAEPWPEVEGLHDGLRELGYHEGENLLLEYRFANSDAGRFPELAAELIKI